MTSKQIDCWFEPAHTLSFSRAAENAFVSRPAGSVSSYAQNRPQALRVKPDQPAMKAWSPSAPKRFLLVHFLLPHWAPGTWRRRAKISISAELPSGKVPATRVNRRIPLPQWLTLPWV